MAESEYEVDRNGFVKIYHEDLDLEAECLVESVPAWELQGWKAAVKPRTYGTVAVPSEYEN